MDATDCARGEMPARGGAWRRTVGLSALLAALGLGWGIAAGLWIAAPSPAPWWNDLPLSASGTVTSDRFSVATAPVDDDVDGLFVLDSLSGELQCLVLNVRNAKFGGKFRTNVLQDFGAAPRKDVQLALVTGQVNFARAGQVSRVGDSVAYVVDPSTGIYAAYALRWRPEIAAAGREQNGVLELLDRGQISVPASGAVVAPASVLRDAVGGN